MSATVVGMGISNESNYRLSTDGDSEKVEFVDVSTLGTHGEVLADHRGGFGEFGGTVEEGFLDRSFRERIVVVGVGLAGENLSDVHESLDELELLIDTAGADVCERIVQQKASPDPATYVGRGKVAEILETALANDADTVVFDNELSPSQQLNLEKQLKRSALGRTAVILDIFAQHATTAEGKAQVELAQLEYNLPRLRHKTEFSQQGGGIGTRGPGETQLEVDRRAMLSRVHKLRRNLKQIARRRDSQRKRQRLSTLKRVSIVGYTNAGKSSLLRRLTQADVLVEDRLFATLDPKTTLYQIPGGPDVLLSDTVGFVKKLPHQLVEAFRSTLEAASEADLLIHLVDGADPDHKSKITAVRGTLAEIGAEDVPTMIVFNKSDLSRDVSVNARPYEAVCVSAFSGEGIEGFVDELTGRLGEDFVQTEVTIPWSEAQLISRAYDCGIVSADEDLEAGKKLTVSLPRHVESEFAPFRSSTLDDSSATLD